MLSTIHFTKKERRIGFIWILLFYYGALIICAYLVAYSIFPETASMHELFGLSRSEIRIFNQKLFLLLLLGILYLMMIHLLSRKLGVKISTGNSILAGLLVLNIFLFMIGITIPLLQTTKLWFTKENLSIIQVLQNLKANGEMQLYYVMLCFTFIVPLLKIVVMSIDIYISTERERKNRLVSLLSKWAMLDVFVVGIVISTMNSGNGFSQLSTEAALTFFILSILMSMIISLSTPYTNNSKINS